MAELNPLLPKAPAPAPATARARPLRLQRKCACGSPTSSLSGDCADCKSRKPLQHKLALGASTDPLEHEADRIAEQVLARPASTGISDAAPRIQRIAGPSGPDLGAAPAGVERVLASPGQPLEPALQQDMSRRFGYDFAHVRIHTNRAAADTADAIGARAFTVGRHIAFGDGEYTRGGPRLLAHELVHTIQQGGVDDIQGALVQRQGTTVETKTDVALVLAGDDISSAEGGALAPVALRITSLDKLCELVDGVGKPIGTMFVVSHADSEGVLRITGSAGATDLTLAQLAAALKKCKRIPDVVDFRGCKVGAASGEVEKFRNASGVTTAVATDCPKFSARSKPIPVDGISATIPSQGPTTAQGKAEFDAALLQSVNGLKADNDKSVAHCLLGFPSRLPTIKDIVVLRKLYWANKGQFVASWASPVDNRDWQKDSRCMKDLTATTSPCARIEKSAPAPAKPPPQAPAKKKSAMHAPAALPRIVLGGDSAAPDESLT